MDRLDDLDRIRAGLPVDGYVDLPPTVDADDIGLNLARVPNVGDIPDQDRGPASHRDRHVVQVGDIRGHRIREDLVVEIASLHVPSGDEYALPLQRLHDIHRVEIQGLELHAVDVSQNASELASVHRRCDHALDGLQAVAEFEIRDVVEFLFVHARAGHAD